MGAAAHDLAVASTQRRLVRDEDGGNHTSERVGRLFVGLVHHAVARDHGEGHMISHHVGHRGQRLGGAAVANVRMSEMDIVAKRVRTLVGALGAAHAA